MYQWQRTGNGGDEQTPERLLFSTLAKSAQQPVLCRHVSLIWKYLRQSPRYARSHSVTPGSYHDVLDNGDNDGDPYFHLCIVYDYPGSSRWGFLPQYRLLVAFSISWPGSDCPQTQSRRCFCDKCGILEPEMLASKSPPTSSTEHLSPAHV